MTLRNEPNLEKRLIYQDIKTDSADAGRSKQADRVERSLGSRPFYEVELSPADKAAERPM